MNNESIRRAFIEYFQERGHLQLPGLSLIPRESSVTTLFTIAGMQQMIGYFMGREEPPARRLLTVQKAIRTGDIEEVGDASHLTFLEMLGNFSVGDYFKREAIGFTWDFLTRTMGVPVDRWWATIYPGDHEAREAWLATGIPAVRIGETEDNWWDQGPVGPCGPDSEIHYDRGLQFGCGREDCRPETECCDRFLEVWNNVFMVYYQDDDGRRTELPRKNIDTGMGFERLVMVAQGAETVYDTDLFLPIIQSVAKRAGNPEPSSQSRRSLRVIADHCRALSFIIADGVMPASDGRGYVLRRLLRRAAMHGRLLGIYGPFLVDPVNAVIDIMSTYYMELVERRDRIVQVVQVEESRFGQTLNRGLLIFEEIAQRAARSDNVIAGRDAFTLYDTYGFPLPLTLELAEERNLRIDTDEFSVALQIQQDRARKGQKFSLTVETPPETYADIAAKMGPSIFTGFDELETNSEIAGIVADGQSVHRAEKGDEVELFLSATPFYAESGGQVGDIGVVRRDAGVAAVLDTQKRPGGLVAHRVLVEDGGMTVGDAVVAEVDAVRRLHILPHHSGTHLVHKALQEVLGPEATQAGSLVEPDRLRFDFQWPRPVTNDEVREVQDRVNAAIWANLPVSRKVMSYEEAMSEGAMALFGEKYGDRVRVVSIGDWSKELCGGTHVDATGDIGLLVIISESGIGSGIRRLEALAGAAAYAYVNDLKDELDRTAEALATKPDNIVARAAQLTTEQREQSRKIDVLTKRLAASSAETLIAQADSIDGLVVVASQIAADSIDYLQATTDAVKSRLDEGIVVLASAIDGKPAFAMAVSNRLRGRGFQANSILREAARRAQGGAGGSADFAQGGGKDSSKIEEVLQTAVELIRKQAEG